MSIKVIEGFEDYFVSDQGEVFSTKSGSMKKRKPCKGGDGYLGLGLCNKGNRKQMSIHRLVAQAFVPNPENKPCVNHIDGNKQNNNANNLEWVTYRENNQYFNEIQKPNGIYDSSEEINARQRRYREEHREELKVQRRRYREAHREEINAYKRRWRAAHPEKIKEYDERYKVKKDKKES